MDNQIQTILAFVEKEKTEKNDLDGHQASELAEIEEKIMKRFDEEAQARVEFEAKFQALVQERFDALENELVKEIKLWEQSVGGLEKHIDSDFENLEEELK